MSLNGGPPAGRIPSFRRVTQVTDQAKPQEATPATSDPASALLADVTVLSDPSRSLHTRKREPTIREDGVRVTMTDNDAAAKSRVLTDEDEVAAHIRAICFKTGPPALVGAELEWTLHRTGAPAAPLDAAAVRQALGRHTPATLDPLSPA